MIDVKRMIGIDCSGVPPWRYFDEIVLVGEEKNEFVNWVTSVVMQSLFYEPSEFVARSWQEAVRVVGLHRGNEGDKERIDAAKAAGWIWMGVVFGREWFAVPA